LCLCGNRWIGATTYTTHKPRVTRSIRVTATKSFEMLRESQPVTPPARS
jgi:hypothetical protein